MPIHLVYRLLFIPAAFVVAAAGAFALGCGLRDARLGASLAAWAGLGAASAFLLINLLMDALGWRVGAPHAAERATMLVVSLLSATAAAIAAGATIGERLWRLPRGVVSLTV